MSKVEAKFFKGIEYILLRDLPAPQKAKFLEWLNDDLIIQIQVGSTVEKDCVQYSDYSYWYDHQNGASGQPAQKISKKTSAGKSVGLAFE